MSPLRAVADASPLIAYRAAAGGMPIALGLFIASRWGLEELAAYTLAAASIAIVSVVADFGATRALPRNLALLPVEGGRQFLAAATAFRFVLAILAAIAGLVAILAGLTDVRVARYLALLFAVVPLTILTTNAISERVVSGNTATIATAVGAGLLVTAGGIAIGLSSDRGPLWMIGAYVAGKVVEAAALVSGRSWAIAPRVAGAGSVALPLWPFGLQMILGIVYSRLAVFTVERMTPRGEFGVFSVAVALQGALALIPASLALLYFPDLTRQAQAGDADSIRRIVLRYTIGSVVGVTVGLAALVLLISPIADLLNVPPEYAAFVLAFAAVTYFTVGSVISGFVMQARGHERLAARLSVITLLLALIYQIVALATFGLPGIVVAAAAGELSAMAIFVAALSRVGTAATGARIQ